MLLISYQENMWRTTGWIETEAHGDKNKTADKDKPRQFR
jgi:hypothetical protein